MLNPAKAFLSVLTLKRTSLNDSGSILGRSIFKAEGSVVLVLIELITDGQFVLIFAITESLRAIPSVSSVPKLIISFKLLACFSRKLEKLTAAPIALGSASTIVETSGTIPAIFSRKENG